MVQTGWHLNWINIHFATSVHKSRGNFTSVVVAIGANLFSNWSLLWTQNRQLLLLHFSSYFSLVPSNGFPLALLYLVECLVTPWLPLAIRVHVINVAYLPPAGVECHSVASPLGNQGGCVTVWGRSKVSHLWRRRRNVKLYVDFVIGTNLGNLGKYWYLNWNKRNHLGL